MEMNTDTLLNAYAEANGMYSFEGGRGVRNFAKLIQAATGKRDFESFFEDNPGAIEAVVEWLANRGNNEVAMNLRAELPEDVIAELDGESELPED